MRTPPQTGARLRARTTVLPATREPAAFARLGPGGFAWYRADAGFVTSGAAALVDPDHAAAVLCGIEHEWHGDALPAPAGPVAVGALPFDGEGALVVPATVTGRLADGRAWCTTIADADAPAPTAPTAPDDAPAPGRFTVTARQDRVRWTQMVDAVLAEIAAGALRKVVLAREVTVESDAPFAIPAVLARLLDTQPGCTVYADGGFVGASPELLVRRSGLRVDSQPMAGTVARAGETVDDDAATARLLASAKEAAEHAVTVDAVVDVLARYCDGVECDGPSPIRLATVTHLATTVTGRLPAARGATADALTLARALHPTPAVGGMPREEALAAIRRVEPFDRGRYGGPVGWVGAGGDGEFAVALRCAEIDGRHARLLAGAGIVDGSVPAAEWAETQAKLEPMLRTLVRP